jgi:uncharacterized protein (TIGR04255 family)
MKRSLPPLHLTKSPLVTVLAQVKISPVAAMQRYIPEIQERLRKQGFPKYLVDEMEEVTFNLGPSQQQQQIRTLTRWAFQNKESTWEIQLDTQTITLVTTLYDRYDTTFEPNLRLALQSVNDVVGIGLATRLGLRYVDLIRLDGEQAFSYYLDAGFLGLAPDKLGVSGMLSRFQSIAKSSVGMLSMRATLMNDGSPLPADLRPGRLRVDAKVLPGETVCFLDLDHFSEQERDFNVEELLRVIADELHDTLDVAFRAATKPEARKVRWGEMEV